jgi:hypothetical protein
MKFHNNDDLVERFSMGRLQGAELTDFEAHLPECDRCQDAVRRMEFLLEAVRSAAEHSRQCSRLMAGLPVSTKSKGQYLLVRAALPNTSLQNIGVLLIDAGSDRLYCRFRRDVEEFAGDEADWFKELPDYISQSADELGAGKCVEGLESTLSNAVRISTRKCVLIEDCAATTVDRLYAKLIRPKVLPFRTHLPQYTLEAAAGRFGRQMVVDPQGWVEVRNDLPLTDDMFVVHVYGHSMEPEIPDVCLCAFRSKIVGSQEGKVLLVEQCNESGGGRYTVKVVRASIAVDPNERGDSAWLHQRLTLQSTNPRYKSWDVASAEKIRVLGEFLFVV